MVGYEWNDGRYNKLPDADKTCPQCQDEGQTIKLKVLAERDDESHGALICPRCWYEE